MGLVWVIGAGLTASPAAAEPAPEAAVAQPTPIYVVRTAGTDPRLLEALETARARLEGEGVALTVATLRPDETAAGRARALVAGGLARGVFWFHDATPGEIRVFLLDADGSAWVRRVPVEPETAEASREAVWLIVEATGRALATGQAVAMEPAEPGLAESQPTTPEAAATREPEVTREAPSVMEPPERDRHRVRRPGLGLGLAYLGDGLAKTVPWQSGVGIDGAIDLRAGWRFVLGYGLMLPWRRGDPPVTWRHRVELRMGPRTASARMELYALVGGALEAVQWRASTGAEGGVRMLGLVTLDGGFGVRLVRNLWLVLEPGASVLVNRFDFVECAAGATRCDGMLERVVLAPWRVRPRARAGVAVRF